jgi:hypothetical protein
MASFSLPGRCVIATLAPARAKRSAVAAPMPPEPPMTSAVFPASEVGSIMVGEAPIYRAGIGSGREKAEPQPFPGAHAAAQIRIL